MWRTLAGQPRIWKTALWVPKDIGEVGTQEDEEGARNRGRGDLMITRANDPLATVVLDVAFVNPTLASHPSASRVAGAAAASKYREKDRK